MREARLNSSQQIQKTSVIVAGVVFLYAGVLMKLGRDWWVDENYSHGLLVPFVIGFIVWREWDRLKEAVTTPARMIGAAAIGVALLFLAAGTLGAELFSQRISLVLMLAGLVIYFFGNRVLKLLAVPFALLLLAIPIPQILFNRIAFPLQIWASQMAVWGIRLFEVPTVRNGNVIDILPKGSTQAISLEVVEACSGIRSLMTLVTLALILAYFTRRDDPRTTNFSTPDLCRAVILMIAAVPIAVLTNAARVTATGVMAYQTGKQAAQGTTHDASGWLVYIIALGLLIGINFGLKKFLKGSAAADGFADSTGHEIFPWKTILPVAIVIVLAGGFINWFAARREVTPTRQELTSLSTSLGQWRQKGSEIKFGEQVESVLGATDYTMREYMGADGRMANIYVGYYASQRTGATYHSPQNCLPGAGWVLSEPQAIDIPTSDGRVFTANRYIIESGIYREVMIYWYQGRGHIEASEYRDKLTTIWDSVTRRRTDGAMVRVMTDVGSDEAAAMKSAADLAARLKEQLDPFIPE